MNSSKHDARRTAKRARSDKNPEVARRKEMWLKAKGARRERITNWNAAWNRAGRPENFPDFDAWSKQRQGQEL